MSNPVYGKMAVESRIREKLPAALWLLLVGLIMFLVWAPFQAGVFNGLVLNFEQPIYWSVLVGSILLLVWAAAFFKNIKLEDQRDWTALLVLLIPITYIIALISAASQYFASNMVLIQSLYAFMFIMGLYLLQNHKANRMIETTLITVAYVIVLFGLFNWLGQGRTVSAIVSWFSGIVVDGQYTQAVWVDANGPRLASVFQYPNTYAAFLMAFFFIAVFGITRSKKWYGQAIHAFMLVPMVLSILLTLSRGGLVFLPVVFVVLLLFLKPAKQILWIVYCVLAGVATLVIAKPVTNLGQQFHLGQINDPAKGWFYVLGASLALAVIAWLIQRYAAPRLESGLSRWADRKLSSLWLPVVSVVVVGILAWLFLGTNLKHILPGNIGERLENLNLQQHSFLERMTFYKDAVKVLKDYPIIGAGGGAWASIFEKYQNNPYSSRQAHSFVMQYLVETGLLGFIIFVAFLIFIFYKYIRGYIKAGEQERDSYFAYFILVFSILIHSLMDFNMSFVFISMLVFLGLGGMAAVMDNRPVAKLKLKPGTMRGLYSTVMVLASIVLIFVSIRYIGASQDVVKAKNLFTTSNDFQEIKTPLDKALSKRGDHPDAVLYMSSLLQAVYSQTKDESFYNEELNLLTNTLKKEPFDKNMYKQLMTLYQSNSENDKAYAVLRDNADRYAYDMNWYEQLIVQSYELGYQALGQQDTAKKDDYFKTGLAAYQHVVAGVEHLKTLPKGQLQGNPFEITQPMVLNAGKMQYMLNDPAKAAEIFKVGIKDDLNDGTNREIARWYLAALQKNGTTDQAVYDRLLQMDPNEKGEIDKITQQNF
ncbi:MAG: O-antigen ligase family protein [Paenibacillus macerans]|uniref:O-antigen ligase family protein n=1 Tax=Paenibacillus macerans TaxID=44252 RepID=UPI000ECE3CAD|nr:O-antigen ligase family protein [Paenibacillus macerans]MDU7473086.1 O-antigen ligase family protein [Paenibacillus macerans]GBK65181.1 polymerase [Paenibacillus macerans]GBK71440.1 polymerase [Paenibacillus macerans]